MANNFIDFDHALKAGMIIGILMKAGISAYNGLDDDGEYTDVIYLRVNTGDPEPTEVALRVLP